MARDRLRRSLRAVRMGAERSPLEMRRCNDFSTACAVARVMACGSETALLGATGAEAKQRASRSPFHSSADRARAMPAWLRHYNSQGPHAALGGKPPISRLPRNDVFGNDY